MAAWKGRGWGRLGCNLTAGFGAGAVGQWGNGDRARPRNPRRTRAKPRPAHHTYTPPQGGATRGRAGSQPEPRPETRPSSPDAHALAGYSMGPRMLQHGCSPDRGAGSIFREMRPVATKRCTRVPPPTVTSNGCLSPSTPSFSTAKPSSVLCLLRTYTSCVVVVATQPSVPLSDVWGPTGPNSSITNTCVRVVCSLQHVACITLYIYIYVYVCMCLQLFLVASY
jgi:hypothetical protein